MFLRMLLSFLVVFGLGLADTLTLRDGKTIEGTFMGGDSRQVRMAVGDRIQSFDVRDVASVHFGAAAPAAKKAEPQPQKKLQGRVLSPDPMHTAAMTATELPAGTPLTIRMIDDVDSERDQVGKTFRASFDEPVMIKERAVIPSGADAVVRLVADRQAGKLTGRTELTLELESVVVNKMKMPLDTGAVTTASESRTGETAKRVGGLAAAGAVIGAIAGGGKGAAIGAATGAGAGTAIQVMTKGETVKIPSETRLTFTLEKPARI